MNLYEDILSIEVKMKPGNSYVIELNRGEHLETSLFSVKKGDKVTFKNGPSLYGEQVKVFTELPKKGSYFLRGSYHQEHEVICWLPGAFRYYCTIGSQGKEVGSGYINVEPEILLGEEAVPLECIQCVTVLSKCLGPHGSWLDRLAPTKESGYNAIHFSPVQELGNSGSCYCLRDQLKLNPTFAEEQNPMSWEQLSKIVSTLRTEWKMLTICDIVLNHSANESQWLQLHPECTYNLENSKHLRPAYLLDAALAGVSKTIASGELESFGISSYITTEGNLEALRFHLTTRVIPQLKLHELFMADVRSYVSKFQDMVSQNEPSRRAESAEPLMMRIIQDPEYRRLGSTIDMELAVSLFNIYRADCYDEDTRRRRCAEAFKVCLEELNSKIRSEIESHLAAAVEACIASVRYFRVQEDGPKLGQVNDENPLFPRYFFSNNLEDDNAEALAYSDDAKMIWAHNGWVMNFDPKMDFAQEGSQIYLRRELIPWGDSVKLRYGEKEEDCPFLWSHMKEYVEQTVKVFDGVRLDNCHSTPIPVAQYLLDAARMIRPDLYVVAELFTNSDLTDNVFVNKLGITSLIRECMSGWDSHEVGRLVYRYGGDVVGSLLSETRRPRKLAPALFLDMSHDNPHPIEKRTIYDVIPSSALVSIAACGTGSTFGYDQLVPHQVDVVKEGRLYMARSDPRFSKGIMDVKKALNKLHFSLVKDGFSQVFVDQLTRDIVAVTRYNPHTMESVILVSYTVFSTPDPAASGSGHGITIPGMAHSVLLQTRLVYKLEKDKYVMPTAKNKFSDAINGLTDYDVLMSERVSIDNCPMLQATPTGSSVRLNLTDNFKPGSVVVIRVISRNSSRAAADKLRSKSVEIEKAVFRLGLTDINFALFRCDGEGGSVYHVPGHGNLVYQGIQGVMSVLEEIATKDDLGHPLCANLRAGPWLGDYIVNRLKSRPSTNYLGDLIQKELKNISELPTGIRPWGYYKVFSQVHSVLVSRALSLLSTFAQEGDELTRLLSLCSVQMVAEVSSLPPLCESVLHSNTALSNGTTDYQASVATLAAGLPHFSNGLMRCWGRDTFISLRGLLLLAGRYHEARCHILGYAGCLRHGLIPNLLDGEGLNPRYNCRDAIFWWLYSIKEYCLLAPAGTDILKDSVKRLYPKDDTPKPLFVEQQLSEVIQEALTVHFQGLVFRERNAGHQIDEHMVSEGFDNQIGIHPQTGFVFGGNEWNCGTWMDKMGSSIEAGTKGKPATPRDGSAVEMVGLLFSVLKWLATLSDLGEYPHRGVSRLSKDGVAVTWSWKEWSQKIKDNFEEEFWVGESCNNRYVNRRNIYKDTCGASQEWADYRLRPNFTVAMVVAPELFNREHAALALKTSRVLEGPLGTKTLDPSDLAYAGDYDNDNNSSDYRVARGFNYHQGPEWLWVSGFYWRARLMFSEGEERQAAFEEARQWLGKAWAHLRGSPWRGLPELTNSEGRVCHHSCPTQAWSAATFLEVLYDLKTMKA